MMTNKTNIIVLAFYTFLALIITWPLILHPNSLIIDNHDGLLITWILNWDIHGLTAGIKNFYNANIFFPFRNTLAFSDLQLPLALIGFPFVFLFGEPLLAYNVNFLLGFVLTAFSVYLLVGKGRAGLIAGLLFSFSSIHLNYMAHVQLFNFWPVVVAIYFLQQKNYRAYVLFFILSGLTTPLFIYFLILVAFFNRAWKPTLFSLLVLGPVLFPYFLVSREWHYVRPITDAIHFSLVFQDLVNVGTTSRLSKFISPATLGTPGYLGAALLVTLILSLRGFQRGKWLGIAAAAFVFALGPALHLVPQTVHIGPLRAIPLPYALFYYLVPGFSGLRTPSRWILLVVLAIVVLVTTRLRKMGVFALWAVGCLVILEISYPFHFETVPSRVQFPPEQQWLAENYPGTPVVYFPIYGWWDKDFGRETLREYFSTINWNPMYNGYSGFSPKEWEDSIRYLQNSCPSESCREFLVYKGVRLVVVDTKGAWGKLVKEFPDAAIYELR